MNSSDVVHERARGTTGFDRSPRIGTVLLDFCLLALPIGVICGVYLLPEAVKEGLVLAYRQPTLVTAYAANFVHFTPTHLLANLLGYAMVVPTAYVFSRLSGRRRECLLALVGIVLAFPLVLSWLNVQLVRPRIGYGFSGLLLALVGLLTLNLGWLIADRTASGFTERHAPLLFFYGTTVVISRGIPMTDLTMGAVVVLGIGVAIYGGDVASRWLGRLRPITQVEVDPDMGLLILGGLCLVFVFQVAAFPADAVNGRSVTNLYVHFLGYALGFITPFGAFQVTDWIDRHGRP